MRSIRPMKVAVGVAALALAMTACTAGSSESSGSTNEGVTGASGKAVTKAQTYKLGLALPLTGSAASYGEEYRAVTDMGVKAANKAFADDGIKIELVSADTQATAEGGVTAMNKLGAVDKAPAVLTAWSAVVAAGASVANDLDFALINAGAQSPALIGASPYSVNVLPMNDRQLAGFTKYLTDDLKAKKFATIYVDNESGQGTAKEFKKAIEARGGQMVAEESIRQDATDASTQVAKVAAAKPDFVYIQTLLVEGAATLKSIREAGMHIPLGSYAGVGESRVIRDAGKDAMNGLYYMSHIPTNIDAVRTLLADLQSNYPKMVIANQSYDGYFYDTPFLYAEVIKRLRAQGAPVNGANIIATLKEAKDIKTPIVGAMDLTNKLTYHAPTVIRQVTDWKGLPMDDKTVGTASAD